MFSQLTKVHLIGARMEYAIQWLLSEHGITDVLYEGFALTYWDFREVRKRSNRR